MPITPPHEIPAPRLERVLHYVIARTVGLGFGEIKLNKTIIAADEEFYRRYGRTITGATTFQKQKYGPVPNGVLKATSALKRGGKIVEAPVMTPSGKREEYAAVLEPDVNDFTSEEIDVLSVAISALARVSATVASNDTHDALWEETPSFGQIPISASAVKPLKVLSPEVIAWAMADDD